MLVPWAEYNNLAMCAWYQIDESCGLFLFSGASYVTSYQKIWEGRLKRDARSIPLAQFPSIYTDEIGVCLFFKLMISAMKTDVN